MSGMEPIMLAMMGAKAFGTIAQGQFANDQAKSAAKQYREQAKRAEALSQREAVERRREANLLSSRALAIAGASGAGVDDPTVENILHDIDTQGEYNVLSALYDGKMQSRDLNFQAKATRKEGKMARTGSYISAIAEMGSSLYDQGAFDIKGTTRTRKV